MWIAIKYEQKNYLPFIQNLSKVLEGDFEVYNPMVKIFIGNKITKIDNRFLKLNYRENEKITENTFFQSVEL